ncbi:MAG: hypothetical protein HMLIMOIP_001294 [Candidatus Nitrosomirales archaeon]|jgi:hypothetical protein
MISLKIGGIIVAAFIAGAFVASPELRAYAADTVGSSDIIDESILSQDIKNGEVKNSDIGLGAITSAKINDGSVLNADIGANAVTTSKIKDGSVTAADIGADAVGASEIQGVTQLIFEECVRDFQGLLVNAGATVEYSCEVLGADDQDVAFATIDDVNTSHCFVLDWAEPGIPVDDTVTVTIRNACVASEELNIVRTGIMVFDT